MPTQDRKRSARRILLVLLMAICLFGAGVLATLGAMELSERRQGDDFYTQLAGSAAAEPEKTQKITPKPTPLATRKATPQATVQPTQAAPEKDLAALRQTCPDLVGWITIADSIVDYPIVQGQDNDFYLHHLADQSPNAAGSIMMDCVNNPDFQDTITILHGHHMRSGSMFGDLEDYKRADYYRDHATIRLHTLSGSYDVAVFAAYTVDGFEFGYPTSFKDQAEFDTFIRRATSATPYETGVAPEFGDRMLMLSTCDYAYDGARFVVLGRIIENS